MPHVVMIAYYFPPEGNAGAYRPLRFVRQLPAYGWQPSVVTVDTANFERYDPALQSAVPAEVEVHRVRNPDPWQALQARRRLQTTAMLQQASSQQVTALEAVHQRPFRARARDWVRTAEAWWYQPDLEMGWIRPATRVVVELCRHTKVEVLWATAGPVSSFLVAHGASQQTGIPYVLDFRDAWTITFNTFEERQPWWARRTARLTMYQLLSAARAVVFRYVTEAECFWQAYPGALDPSKVHIIPNGFEGDSERYDPSVPAQKCRILYAGTLGDYRYDTLLQALHALKQETPQLAQAIQIDFVGEDTAPLGMQVKTLGLEDMVSWTGAVPFAQVASLSRAAHAFLVLGRYPSMRGYELFAPAKLFGYLQAGRPILAVLPEDEAKRILQQVGVTTVAQVDNVADIVAMLQTVIRAWQEGRLATFTPKTEACRAFSSTAQTAQLVQALTGVVAVSPFVPGRVEIPPSLRKEIQCRHQEAEHWQLVG